MSELDLQKVVISDATWSPRLQTNASRAIFHQWEMLEASGCIDNFRIAAGEKEGFREGWFFADSDAYKWLDAAARICQTSPEPRLTAMMDGFVHLLGRAQQADGYLFTYNQIHFPDVRWSNLQIEHELYCHGHLIEAGVSHHLATRSARLLNIARRAADRIVADFLGGGPQKTPGHEEIEISLLRLYQVCGHIPYLELAQQFIEQRGRNHNFARELVQQNTAVEERKAYVRQQRQAYISQHPEHAAFQLPPGNPARQPPGIDLRWKASTLTGKYFQQHLPVRKQSTPVGHAVRFGYLQTAMAMLQRARPDANYLTTLQQVWKHMVTRRMYVTGGIGSLPALEGFGRDYELDPEYAYAETCAAIACLFWNWEMGCLTHDSRYSDLFEWQLYNAASVGMGAGGDTYLYNNPLASRGGIQRLNWYAVPCCPSNLSRTWADLRRYIYTCQPGEISIHQYIGSQALANPGVPVQLTQLSGLPWEGSVTIHISPETDQEFTLYLRIPSWSGENTRVQVNGEQSFPYPAAPHLPLTACGFDPRQSRWCTIRRVWTPGDRVELHFDLAITLRRAHPKVKGHRGKVALTRGPLVYCLESVDNRGLDIFTVRLSPSGLNAGFDPDLLSGAAVIYGHTVHGEPVTAIPYHLWGNRGPSQMNVWLRS